MSKFVRFVTVWLGVPPRPRTTAKASARVNRKIRQIGLLFFLNELGRPYAVGIGTQIAQS
jgi:hypothetical protein